MCEGVCTPYAPVPVHSTHSPFCAEHQEAFASGCVGCTQKTDSARARACVCGCVCQQQTRPLATLGAQSPFPVVHCDKFPCQILPAPLYF